MDRNKRENLLMSWRKEKPAKISYCSASNRSVGTRLTIMRRHKDASSSMIIEDFPAESLNLILQRPKYISFSACVRGAGGQSTTQWKTHLSDLATTNNLTCWRRWQNPRHIDERQEHQPLSQQNRFFHVAYHGVSYRDINDITVPQFVFERRRRSKSIN